MADPTVFGYNFPFLSSTSVLSPQADERIIKNDLKQLLLTNPGERVMRPDYGVPIRATLFDPLDNALASRLHHYIEQAIKIYEPRVRFREISISTDPDKNLIEITVLAALTRNPNRVLAVDLEFAVGSGVSTPAQQRVV